MDITRRKILKALGLAPVVAVAGKAAIEEPVRAATIVPKINSKSSKNNLVNSRNYTKEL